MVHSGVLFISEWQWGSQTPQSPGVTYPLPHPLDGPGRRMTKSTAEITLHNEHQWTSETSLVSAPDSTTVQQTEQSQLV